MASRVLLVVGSPLLNAGVPNVIMSIVRQLYSKYTFDVLCLSEEEGYYDAEFQSYGGVIYRMTTVDYSQHKLRFSQRMLQIGRKVSCLLKQRDYAVIHCHCGIDAGICLAVGKQHGVKVRIAHAHGTYIRKGRNLLLRFYNWLNKGIIVMCSTNRLACSEIAGKTLYLGKEFDNVLNPIDVEYYRSVEKKEHCGLQLMQIGYFCKNKNQLFSLHIVNELLARGVDVAIRFIGFEVETGYFAEMQEYIMENGLVDHVTFLPPDVDKRKHLEEVDYTVVPSESEGLPLVALESQAANVPCVLSNNVPVDVNMGLAYYLPIDSVDAWVEFFTSPKSTKSKLNSRIFQLEPHKFAEKIGQAYECAR